MNTPLIDNTAQREVLRNMLRQRGYGKEEETGNLDRVVVMFTALDGRYVALAKQDMWMHIEAGLQRKLIASGKGYDCLVEYLRTLPKIKQPLSPYMDYES
jgi:hypothetical protein